MSGVPFYKHHLGQAEADSIVEALKGVFLTTGPRTRDLEGRFAELLGVKHGVGVGSCTQGLFLSLAALGIGEGDEVITTPMTFIATSNTVLHTGATPVFVDVEADTGNLDAGLVEAAITERTKVILPVHLYGQMADMVALRKIADKHGLKIVEDAAHAAESVRDGHRPGQLGELAAFSFYATKNITCGEGGFVATNDPELDEKLRNLRLHGMSKNAYERYSGNYQHWDMTALGYKANLNDLQAALLLPQLEGIERRLEMREALAAVYDKRFAEMEGVERHEVREGARSAHHLYTIWVDPERRDEVLGKLQKAEIGVAVNYRAVHLLTYYRERFGFEPGSFPNAERIGDSTISLPFYPLMSHDDAHRVCEAVQTALS